MSEKAAGDSLEWGCVQRKVVRENKKTNVGKERSRKEEKPVGTEGRHSTDGESLITPVVLQSEHM